ncbi:hypothetical protein CCACVL1_01073, partial [Corchorus capsularis]
MMNVLRFDNTSTLIQSIRTLEWTDSAIYTQ